ncbi:MAG: glycoside hydrolase family 3 C-terminal domain-containing protein [Clostridia bacterium]|nr:glycoside hydrolase family 3 C-terminal domain-containing protein [Clostridia bacterium]
MATLKRKIILIINFVCMAIIIAGFVAGNVICGINSNIITSYLVGFGLDDDSGEAKEARQEGNMLAASVMEDGAVLLKNNNGALPLKEKKVNVFGWAGSDKGFIPQGTGSGTGARNDMVTFLGGLSAAKIEYNTELAEAYASLNYRRVENESGNYTIEASSDNDYKLNYGVIEADEDFLTDARISQAKAYSNNAVVVLGRLLGEGNDYSKTQYIKYGDNDNSRKLQAISVKEQAMLDRVCAEFENVIVVINSTNPMEAGFLDNEKIDAAIYMGTPGTRGAVGLANLLAGDATPSGHLTDTWAYDLSTAASYATSGREGVGRYNVSNSLKVAYSDYIEDIYVGYKWYETADATGFWESDVAKEKWNLTDGYKQVVQYPFGFGLSYTNFEWSVVSVDKAAGSTLGKDDYITVEVDVKNIGSVKGKDVVQLYYTPPYTAGGIEKASVNLLAFAKTIDIEPGDTDTVYLEFAVSDMKSYDCYDRNNNGFMGYELEGGEYTLTLRTDAHTVATPAFGSAEIKYTVPEEGFKYELDPDTEKKVENRFTNYTNETSGATSTIAEPVAGKAHSIDGNDEPTKITYLTRQNFAGTFPFVTPENRELGTLVEDTMYVKVDPDSNSDDVAPITDSTATNWTIEDMYGVDLEDDMWNEIVSQMTLKEQMTLIACGGFGTVEIESVGMKKTVASDGPSGFNNQVTGQGNLKAVNYPSATVIAQTWDFDTAYSVGLAIGTAGAARGVQGWYGPGANLHRSPLGGRNFEYYSEDARLSGIMVAYEVMGAKEKGITAYIKHIAVNDSDTGRNGAYKWLTEQALRELYLMPFEYAVKIGSSNGMMSSVDRIGSTRVSGSYALLKSVLRDEWEFRGTVITDYYQVTRGSRQLDRIHDVDECVRAGNDMLLHPDGVSDWFDDATSNTAKKCIAEAAKNILFTYADTMFFASISGEDITFRKTPEVFPWWIILLVGVDVVVAGVIGVWMWLILKKRKPKEATEIGMYGDLEGDGDIYGNNAENEVGAVAEEKDGKPEQPLPQQSSRELAATAQSKEIAATNNAASLPQPMMEAVGEVQAEIIALGKQLSDMVGAVTGALEEIRKAMPPKKKKPPQKKDPNKPKAPSTKQRVDELTKQIEELRAIIAAQQTVNDNADGDKDE